MRTGVHSCHLRCTISMSLSLSFPFPTCLWLDIHIRIVKLALTSCSTSISFSMRCVANILALLMSNLLWETVRGFSCLGLCLDTCLHRSWMWLWNFGQPNFWFCMECFHGWIEGCLKGCCDKYIRISFERI
jgi:hypothetical protein